MRHLLKIGVEKYLTKYWNGFCFKIPRNSLYGKTHFDISIDVFESNHNKKEPYAVNYFPMIALNIWPFFIGHMMPRISN
jgi:hypothetical protein